MSIPWQAILGKYVVAHHIKEEDIKSKLILPIKKIKTMVTIPANVNSKVEALRHKNANRKNQTRNLVSLAGGAQDNLFNAKTVFPFVLFTDTLKIDRQK